VAEGVDSTPPEMRGCRFYGAAPVLKPRDKICVVDGG